MIKKLFLILSILTISLEAFAQSEITQQVFPKRIYVGDKAELRYNFRSAIDFFEGAPESDEIPLALSSLPFAYDNGEYSIEAMKLQRNGPSYTLVITFVPWKTGSIKISEFDLLKVMERKSSVPFLITPLSFEVLSLIQESEETSLRPAASPLFVPGTIYILYAIILLIIGLLILLIRLYVIREKIRTALVSRKILKTYAKNARRTIRHLKKLSKRNENLSDENYCEKIQQMMRHYLSVRFGKYFESISTDKVPEAVNDSTGGFLSEEKQNSVSELYELFIRCDYVRFSHVSGLEANERNELVKKAENIISGFEKKEEQKDA